MKALLVADNEKAIENISQVLKTAGYDIIIYRWLLKALDNIEEISPHLIVVSTADYPRHWKTLAQYATTYFGDYKPQLILFTDENFNEEEQKKADFLKVRGCFDSIGVEGLDKLREILSKNDDIYSGHLTDEDYVPDSPALLTEESEESAENLEEITDSEDADELPEEIEESEESAENLEELIEDENAAEHLEEMLEDEKAADLLEEIAGDEKACDRLEEIVEDEKAADKLESLEENEPVPTVEDLMKAPYDESDSVTLPGIDELKQLLENEKNFEDSESDDIISESTEENEDELSEKGESTMADEQSIDEKLAEIMNANKADAKEKAEALKIETQNASAVSFVFTNPVTLAMVSGVARNYNGLVLEFTPDIPSFILNLSPGTKISVASMKIDDKIENVFAEVMSNDAKKLALAIKKIS